MQTEIFYQGFYLYLQKFGIFSITNFWHFLVRQPSLAPHFTEWSVRLKKGTRDGFVLLIPMEKSEAENEEKKFAVSSPSALDSHP